MPSDSRELMANATSATLLHALKATPTDPTAWDQFMVRYQGLIRGWCSSFGLQSSDCQDVTQEVLLKLSKVMQDFQYNPEESFRAWLKTVTHHAWVDWTRTQRKPGQGHGDTGMLQALHQLEAANDLAQRLEAEYDAELMEVAMLRVRMRVQLRTWQAFEKTALEGSSGAEVARELGMSIAHVYVAKSHVLKALQDEVQKLDHQQMRGTHTTHERNAPLP